MGRRTPSNDGSLIKDVENADKSRQLLGNKLLNETLDFMRDNIFKKWENTQAYDKEGREDLWHQLHGLNEFKRKLELNITHGKRALEKLNG